MKNRHFFLLFMMCCLVIFSSDAQTCSCAGTPLTNSLGIGVANRTDLQFQLRYDYHVMKHLVSGNKILETNQNQRITESTLLQIGLPLGKKWQIMAVFSWMKQRFLASNEITSQGLGDVVLLGQYQIFEKNQTSFYAGLGTKIPTGKIDRTTPDGILLSPDLQTGTGAWDGVLMLSYLQEQLWNPQSSLVVSGTYRTTSTTDRLRNAQSYRFGSELLAQAGITNTYFIGNQQVMPSLLFRYRQTKADVLNTVIAPNTGGKWFNIGLGLHWQYRSFGLQMMGLLPSYQHLKGTQLTSSFRYNLTFNFNIPIKNTHELITYEK